MIANFTFGNFFATVATASAMRKPTPLTRSYFCWARVERFGMQSALDFEIRVRPWTPSCRWASSRPLLARKLNERSLRPPMSVTRPTLSFEPLDAADDELLLELPPPLSSLPPHAATPRAPTARLRAMAIARDALRCTAPPLRFLLAERTPSAKARESTSGARRRRPPARGAQRAAPARRSSPRSPCA